jgi:uncharacterized protein YjbI with pentapeptide repeats
VVTLDGETYNLDYTPGEGFSYVPASGTGAAITGGGALGAPAGTYPFDVTDATKVMEAAAYFGGLDRSDPNREPYVDAFNAAIGLGTVSGADLDNLKQQLSDAGVYNIDNVLALPSQNYNMPVLSEDTWELMVRRLSPQFSDPLKVQELYGGEEGLDAHAVSKYGSWKNWALSLPLLSISQFYVYADRETSPLLEQYPTPTTPGEWAKVTELLNSDYGRDHFFALNHLAHKQRIGADWTRNIDWTKIDNMEGFYMKSLNLEGTNIDGSLLNTLLKSLVKDDPKSPAFFGTKLSGLNLTGFDMENRAFLGVNFANSTGLTGIDFTKTRSMTAVNVSNLNMTGFSGDGKVLLHVNFSGASGLTPQSLAKATHLSGTNLMGTGITRAQLEAALTEAGTNYQDNSWINLDTIKFDDNWQTLSTVFTFQDLQPVPLVDAVDFDSQDLESLNGAVPLPTPGAP